MLAIRWSRGPGLEGGLNLKTAIEEHADGSIGVETWGRFHPIETPMPGRRARHAKATQRLHSSEYRRLVLWANHLTRSGNDSGVEGYVPTSAYSSSARSL